ncbi:MAG: hypothetical protein H7Z12_10555 [Rhodospirillaceae bacterium]|nr:hypothetical protein [Rhodospirillales bacterium]
MPINAIPLLIPGCGYKIDYAARFRGSAATAYLYRTPVVAGNRRVFTYATWLRRTAIGGAGCQLLGAGPDASNATILYLNDGAGAGGPEQYAVNLLHIVGGAIAWAVYGLGKLRDQAGWYHIVVSVDLTAASNKVRMWVNGAELSIVALTGAVTNSDTFISSTNQHWISRRHDAPSAYNDQMLADNVLLDGVQVSSPASFGALANAWTPKQPSGLAFGPNGFCLEFRNPAAMGADTSGQGNHWTASGVLSTDQMADTPTNVFATLDPLDTVGTLSNGALTLTAGASHCGSRATLLPGGNVYFEATVAALTSVSAQAGIGLSRPQASLTGGLNTIANIWGMVWTNTRWRSVNGTSSGPAATAAAGAVMQMAFSPMTGDCWVGLDNVWFDSANGTTGNPSTGANPTFTALSGDLVPFFDAYGNAVTANFGQRPWAFTPPSGFKALCTGAATLAMPTASGAFTGNLNAAGPRIHCDGSPTSLTINGNPVIWGTHALKLADGFKVISPLAAYNASGPNAWVAVMGSKIVTGDCRIPNNAQVNP